MSAPNVPPARQVAECVAWSHASDGTPYTVFVNVPCEAKLGGLRCVEWKGHVGPHWSHSLTPGDRFYWWGAQDDGQREAHDDAT